MAAQTEPVERDAQHPMVETNPEEALRAGIYSLLGRLLAAAPTQETLEVLRGIEVPAGGDSGIAEAWATLRAAAERADPEALAGEYHDLFLGVPMGELVPYASFYLTGSLFERPLILLRQDLERLGFERQEGVVEPEDHVAAVCDTMALLISNAAEVPFEEQQAFYTKHMEPWMNRFFDDLQQAQAAQFYRAVGLLGSELLRLERQYLSMLV